MNISPLVRTIDPHIPGLIPVWYLLATTPDLPEWIAFIGPKEPGRVPLWVQFLLLQIGLDLLRMALVHAQCSGHFLGLVERFCSRTCY